MDRLDAETGHRDGVVALDPRSFGATHAILTFVLMIVAQMAAGIAVIFYAVVRDLIAGKKISAPAYAAEMSQQMMPLLVIASAVATVLIALLLLRMWAWHLVRDRTPAGLGLFAPTRKQLVMWAIAGLVAGALYVTLATFVDVSGARGGPLSKMAAQGGGGRLIWAILAVFVAPPVEELLFRGLMLRGLMASWGRTAAGIVVTLLFFALHLFEAANYWPAMAAIMTLSILTLLARLRTGSVVAAIAVHAAYNLALVVAVYVPTLSP